MDYSAIKTIKMTEEILSKITLKSIETPCYCYDLNLLKKTIIELVEESNKYDFKIHYALKANSNPEILKLISKYQIGADCVSGNEVSHALLHGCQGL